MDWQPIETAPKMGKILISCLVKRTGFRTSPHIYEWAKTNDNDKYKHDGWSDGGDYYGVMWLSNIYEPTHWMPLPENPKLNVHKSKGEDDV